jgi:hypothetical protein
LLQTFKLKRFGFSLVAHTVQAFGNLKARVTGLERKLATLLLRLLGQGIRCLLVQEKRALHIQARQEDCKWVAAVMT